MNEPEFRVGDRVKWASARRYRAEWVGTVLEVRRKTEFPVAGWEFVVAGWEFVVEWDADTSPGATEVLRHRHLKTVDAVTRLADVLEKSEKSCDLSSPAR